jgi:hypothetical protein
MNNKINYFITKKKIPSDTKLKYLITIPCVNREERNAVNIIDKTFEIFEQSGLFSSDIDISIMLFESGSNDKSYLNFLEKYNNEKIKIIYSTVKLDGNSNTLKMFYTISKLPPSSYDFIIWMDDDIFVCNNFIKNADAWIKEYANYSLFSSLYVPYESVPVLNRKFLHLSDLPGFYGTCCTIFKPALAKYVLPHWYNNHFNQFNYNPDTRFRDSLKKEFPNARKICVSFPSFVDHMNIGSAIKMKKEVKIGHKAKFFIGSDKDPMVYNIFK